MSMISKTGRGLRSGVACMAIVLAMAAGTTPGYGQEVKQARAQAISYSIPAGPLGQVISRFANRANLQILYPAGLVRGKTSGGLSGSHSVESGLTAILSGSGLSYRLSGGNTVTIVDPSASSASQVQPLADGSTVLQTINVEGDGSTTEGTNSYTTREMATATGLPLSIAETPQSVTVITRQRMEDQASTSLRDALESASGMTTQQYDSDRTEYTARGFAITEFQYDGVAVETDGVYDFGLSNADMTIYDHVEVVKGANGLLMGAGSPGAAVNLVRKRPTDSFQGSVTGTLGAWNTYRSELDVSGPLNADGSVRGRFAGSFEDGESYLDHYEKKSFTLYGALEADIGDSTTLSLGADYQQNRPRGSSWTGLPMFFSDGTRTDWDVSTNPATTWSRRDTFTNNFFVSLDHEFDNGWKAELTYNHRRNGHDSVLGSAGGGFPDPVTGAGVSQFVGKYSGRVVQDTVDAKVSGPVELFGREHDLMFGATASRRTDSGPWYGYGGVDYDPSVPDFFQWDGDTKEPDFALAGHYEDSLTQYGAYAAARLKPTDDLSVILGGRISWWDFNDRGTYDIATDVWNAPGAYSAKGKLTPYAGIVYDFNDVYSVYASYTDIFRPQGNQDIGGAYLVPEEGTSYEAGVKGSFFDGALNASAAVFMTKQDNLAEVAGYDPVRGGNYYRAVQGVTTKGFELEASGEILPDWNIYASYTHARARKANGDLVYSFIQTSAPDNVVKLYTSYTLPGEWENLTIGGGLRWQDEIHGYVWSPANAYQNVTQKNVLLVDAMAKYRFSEKIDVSFNVKNLFNEKYFAGLGNFDTGFYGEPRSFSISTKFKF